MTLEDAVREIYFWQNNYTGCFHDLLFDLMRKADTNNYAKLNIAFPEEAEAYYLWCKAGNRGYDLFRKYGLIK